MQDKVVVDLITDRLDDIKQKVDKVHEDIGVIKLETSRNTDNLVTHMKRTELNEKRLQILEERLSIGYLLKLSISTAIGLGSIATAIYSVIKLFSTLQ